MAIIKTKRKKIDLYLLGHLQPYHRKQSLYCVICRQTLNLFWESFFLNIFFFSLNLPLGFVKSHPKYE